MKNFNYLLIEQDPDGRTNEVTTTLVAILGADTKKEIERLALRTIAKHNTDGDFTKIAFFEDRINAEERAYLHEAIETDNPGLPCVPSAFYFLQPIVIKQNQVSSYYPGSRRHTFVVEDEESRLYRQVSDIQEETACDVYQVALIDMSAYDSPFIYASPFRVKDGKLYAVDAQTGQESGPYDNAEWDYGFYVVSRNGKVALVSLSGKPLTDGDVDSAFYHNGYALLRKDGKTGLYSPRHDLLIACDYDDIECPADEDEYVTATKGGVEGLLATDGSFHPLTDEDPDENFEYL